MSMARTATSAQSSALSARPTSSAIGGKCTERVSTLLPEQVDLDFKRWALESGYPSASDALRELVIVATYGAEYLTKLHADRVGRIAQNMAGIGAEGSR